MAILQYKIKCLKIKKNKERWKLWLKQSGPGSQWVKELDLDSKVKVAQSCLTHRDRIDCNSPGQNIGVGSLSLLRGIFPTQGWNPGLPHCRWVFYQLNHQGSPRTLEWAAYLFGEGNGNPLQCSCLENPRDGAAWWAAASGVAQSPTRLKQLSSINSRLSLLHRIFPTQESNWGLLHGWWILY